MDVFETCREINDFLTVKEETKARNKLIQLLDYLEQNDAPYTSLVNHFIRETGLYPYLRLDAAAWDDRFVHEAFKVDVGRGEQKTLHREQSFLLKKIIDGESVAVSAPTSFGKSFIIDAFIAINQPNNIVIIVPTIALMDETRRRLYKKFSDKYKIITSADVPLSDKNLLVFPQERALSYVDKLSEIDLLIIDEFYKASVLFDRDRSPSLIRAIIKLSDKAKQRYFLAPNIRSIKQNPFTEGMTFVELLGFNTVYLEKFNLYEEIKGDEAKKGIALLKILSEHRTKTLIYAGTYADIDRVSNLIMASHPVGKKPLLHNFADWLAKNYDPNWKLTHLARRGAGVHNGNLHRSLSQIQIKLFEEERVGLDHIISTSSIIEGVNTSAENVIVWRSRNGRYRLTDFSYKNIIGRGGRMFRHFIGKIYLLDTPPTDEQAQLDIPFPTTLMADVDEERFRGTISDEQIDRIAAFKAEMRSLLGGDFDRLVQQNLFQSSDSELLRKIALDMRANPQKWNGLGYLNSQNPEDWERLLYRILELQAGEWDIRYSKFVKFIKVLSKNWHCDIPSLLQELAQDDIDVDKFFALERKVSFKLSALMADVNEIQKAILKNGADISPFVFKLSHAFLPSIVYQLEEYGLPRMLSKKIDVEHIIDLTDSDLTIYTALSFLHQARGQVLASQSFDEFDKYIFKYFIEGITLSSEDQNAA